MKKKSKWSPKIEIALWALGISLLGLSLDATLVRWTYQAKQERALFQRGPAVSSVRKLENVATPPQPPATTKVDPVVEVVPSAVHDFEGEQSTPAAQHSRPIKRDTVAEFPAIGKLEIPRLGVAAIVADGADDATLARAVGHVPGSAMPGERGNMVLAGHRDTFFRPLRDIEVNDRIIVVVPPDRYEYRVQSMRVVEPEERSVLASKGTEELTLVTCYPFRFIGPAPERFIVSATRMN